MTYFPLHQTTCFFIPLVAPCKPLLAFVNKIINHIELNGYMENVAELTKPPFDKPISFIKLFDAKTRTALMETINQVRENAVQITAS